MLSKPKSRIKQLIHYATQAPSGHNTQPWRFKINKGCINLYPDFSRELPIADPQHRELYISLGCAVENLVTAADALGIDSEVTLVPFDEGEYSVQIWLSDEERPDYDEHILEMLDQRQTNRSIYRDELLSPNILNDITRIPKEEGINLHFYQRGTKEFELLSSFALRASVIQMQDQGFKRELINWIRFNPKQVNETEDGLSYETLGAPKMPPFVGKVVLRTLLNPEKQNKELLEKINSSSHLLLLTTKEKDIPDWIRVGRYLERILLHLTDLGIVNAYVNPPCQVENVAEDFRKVMEMEEYPTMLLRLGFAAKMPYSRRRPIEEVIEKKGGG